MTKDTAEKSRNCLAKGLFENLFRDLVQCMNENQLSSITSVYAIGILDIAGFGVYFTNVTQYLTSFIIYFILFYFSFK